jgi:hypothetical protein
MDGVVVLYVFTIAMAAQCSGWYYLLCPELAAIFDDVLTRPWGRWARLDTVMLTHQLLDDSGTLLPFRLRNLDAI